MSIKSISFRVDEKILKKLHVVSRYYGRSTNKQAEILFRLCVKKFEEEHGEIILDEEETQN